MGRTENQKQKLLLVKDYLERNTDVDHPASATEIIKYLSGKGIDAERKSIYHDIQALIDFGMDIESVRRGEYSGYYVASRQFELPELKLLVDAVQSSRFLSERKSMKLIRSLASLSSVHEASLLQRHLVVSGRVKTMNESIFYIVDAIHDAIANNSRIRFTYSDWGVDRKRHPRGEPREASPYALCWADENYYLIAHTEAHGLTHYRVDKMSKIVLLHQSRCMDTYAQVDLAAYSKRVFNMFNGAVTNIRLRFHNTMAGVVIDRFGVDSILIPDGEDHFTLSADVAVSPMFMGWLAGLGSRAEILTPQSVRDQYRDYLKEVLSKYE